MNPIKNYVAHLLFGDQAMSDINNHTCPRAEPTFPLFELQTTSTAMHEHLMTLYMLSVQLKLKTIVELGTDRGDSTLALLLAAKEIGGHVSSFDIASCKIAIQRIRQQKLSRYWTFTQTDSLEAKWSKSIDHLFIDTSHTYNQTFGELRKFEPLIRNGGIITMHDAVPPNIKGTNEDVAGAVKDYFRGRRDAHIYTYVNCSGLFVIFKEAER